MKFKNGLVGFFTILLFFFIAMQIYAQKFNTIMTEDSESETESYKQMESEFIFVSCSNIEKVNEEISISQNIRYYKYVLNIKNNQYASVQSPPPECL
jgi:hypothetical protein